VSSTCHWNWGGRFRSHFDAKSSSCFSVWNGDNGYGWWVAVAVAVAVVVSSKAGAGRRPTWTKAVLSKTRHGVTSTLRRVPSKKAHLHSPME
jgi:hypothetical protein